MVGLLVKTHTPSLSAIIYIKIGLSSLNSPEIPVNTVDITGSVQCYCGAMLL